MIRCSALFIDQLQHSRSATATLAPTVAHAGATASLGTVGGGLGSVTTYRADALVDPEVEVSLLQGAETTAASGRSTSDPMPRSSGRH